LLINKTYIKTAEDFFLGLANESATFTHEVIEVLFSIYEFSPYEQFSWNKLPLQIKEYLYTDRYVTSTENCEIHYMHMKTLTENDQTGR
jgi:hypothetical protein